jgi:hypothetical protein
MKQSNISVILVALLIVVTSCNLLDTADEQIIDISGKVTEDGTVVKGAIALLVKSTTVADGLSLANGSITDNVGNYMILNVEPDNYYVLAIDDQNDNAQFDSGTDKLGFYGVDPSNQDILPDKIKVDDEDLEDIDIVDLYTL